MAKKKMQTICGFSCTDCNYLEKECPGCEAKKGKVFWTAYVGADCCPIYDCCVNDRRLPHCGKCPDLVCERYTRFKDPNVSEEVAAKGLVERVQELRNRK